MNGRTPTWIASGAPVWFGLWHTRIESVATDGGLILRYRWHRRALTPAEVLCALDSGDLRPYQRARTGSGRRSDV